MPVRTSSGPAIPVVARSAHSPRNNWVASSKPPSRGAQVLINNVNAQGSDIPINIGNSAPIQETVVVDSGFEPIFAGGGIHDEPLNFHFTGPADPDRLLGMALALLMAFLPLIIDWARDWPVRSYSKTEYFRPLYHWLILGIFAIFALYTADRQLGWSVNYGPRAVATINGLQSYINPAVVATVEGSENLVWTVEDMVLGDGRHVLGIAMSVGLLILVSLRKPLESAPKTEYAAPSIQFLYLLGVGVVGLFLWNA